MRWLLIALLVIGLTGLVGRAESRAAEAQALIPRCEEDAVLIGVGRFIDGRWDRYVCGPAADD